jgi:hypothetical protein
MLTLPHATDAPDADPLSDEIAIDFPSMDALLERMQAAFFGPSLDACVSACVVLSPREAQRGAVVPLDVSLPDICAACGGRGERWSDPCEPCGGTGSRVAPHRVRVTLPAGVRDGAVFHLQVAPGSEVSAKIEVRVAIA